MARIESDREDLMREATACVRRAEFTMPGEPSPVFVGFRSHGALSIYFGGDPVYHFDAEARLRRAFVSGDLYRTQGTTLARLQRHRLPGSVELLRRDLDHGELTEFLDLAGDRLSRFLSAHDERTIELLASHPETEDVVGLAADIVRGFLDAGRPLAPTIKGRR